MDVPAVDLGEEIRGKLKGEGDEVVEGVEDLVMEFLVDC